MPFAAALSEHPLATHAVGEVVGDVLEQIGPEPDLAVLFVSAPHTGVLEDIHATVRTLLRPRALLGCTAGMVAGGEREAEDVAAISLWAGRGLAAAPYRLEASRSPDGVVISGLPARGELPPGTAALLVLTDPFTFPADELVAALGDHLGVEPPVVGGQASAARGPGGNRLLLDDTVHTDGAVAVALGGVDVRIVVSQGCRPIGDPMVVTRGAGSLIEELAGRPALQRVQDTLGALPAEDLELARQGLHIGRVVDEHKARYEQGDFLIRTVLGADRRSGAVAVDDDLAVGATVQLQVRDANSADDDLRQLLAGRRADTALLFTCNGRGTHLFGVADHDAQAVSDAFDRVPVAGMSCAGELGPIGGHSFLHTFTASVLLLSDRG